MLLRYLELRRRTLSQARLGSRKAKSTLIIKSKATHTQSIERRTVPTGKQGQERTVPQQGMQRRTTPGHQVQARPGGGRNTLTLQVARGKTQKVSLPLFWARRSTGGQEEALSINQFLLSSPAPMLGKRSRNGRVCPGPPLLLFRIVRQESVPAPRHSYPARIHIVPSSSLDVSAAGQTGSRG